MAFDHKLLSIYLWLIIRYFHCRLIGSINKDNIPYLSRVIMENYSWKRRKYLEGSAKKKTSSIHWPSYKYYSLLSCSFFSQNLLNVITCSLICSFLYLLPVLAQNLIFCVRWDVHDLYLVRRELHSSISRSNSWNQKQSDINYKTITSFLLQAEFRGRSIWQGEKRYISWKRIPGTLSKKINQQRLGIYERGP